MHVNGCMVIWLYGWAMSQKLPVNKLEWIEDNFQFDYEKKSQISRQIHLFLASFRKLLLLWLRLK